jgi:hypothetical protein
MTMNARQVNALLWVGTATLAGGAAAALLACLAMPLERVEIGDARSQLSAATGPSAGGEIAGLAPLASFEAIWSRRLRDELGSPSAPQQAAAQAKPAPATTGPAAVTDNPPPVMLVGTIGNSLAMLKTPSNAVEVCGVGETLNGVTVVAVRPAEVDVRYMGRVIKLSKPAEE